MRRDACLVHRRHARVDVVLGAFAALHEGAVAARDHPHDHLGWCAEGRGALARVEHAEASGRSGAYVDEPPAALQRGHHQVDRAREFRADGPDRRRHRCILRVDQFDDLERGRDVDALGLGVTLLGEPRVAEVGDGHDGGRMAPSEHYPGRPQAAVRT